MSHKSLSVAFCVAALMAAPIVASAQIPAPAARSAAMPDEARIRAGVEILKNLRIFERMLSVADQKISSNPEVPVADRPILIGYLHEESARVEQAWLRRVAIECAGQMNSDQLGVMLKLSKTKFMQESLSAGIKGAAQPAVAAEEQAFVNSDAVANASAMFFNNFTQELLMPEVIQAATRANERYMAYKQPKS